MTRYVCVHDSFKNFEIYCIWKVNRERQSEVVLLLGYYSPKCPYQAGMGCSGLDRARSRALRWLSCIGGEDPAA